MDTWYAGNADADAHENREWLVGHFKAPDDIRHDADAEVKVSRHQPGDERPNGWATGEQRRTYFMLVAGGPFEVTLRRAGETGGKTEVLAKLGDYLVWGPGTDHVWRAVGASQVATFRWLPRGEA